jgi:hypothetical protein
MDIVNSLNLTHQDGYYHRFTHGGDYLWGLQIKQAYIIHVRSAPGPNPAQTVIHLTFENGVFQVANPTITINLNDHVLWHLDTPDTNVPPYSVVGDNKAWAATQNPPAAVDSFSSRGLGPEDAFSHMFLTPSIVGSPYGYIVSGGIGGPQNGTIPVLAPPSPAPPAGIAVVNLNTGQPPAPEPVKKAGNGQVYIGDTVLWDVVTGGPFVIKTV